MTNCIIRYNTAYIHGGGYYNDAGHVYIYSSIFEENTSYSGGACYIRNGCSFFTNCEFKGNNSEFGGGAVYLSHTDSRFINCLFSYNESDFGGAFYTTSYSSAKIINSTIVCNHAVFNGGGYLTVIDDCTEIYNTIFYYNDTDAIPGNQINIGSAVSETYLKFCNIQNGLDGISGHPEIMHPPFYMNNIEASPLFADSLEDFTLLVYSPCIDTGTLALPDDIELPEFDLAGNPRIYGDIVDIGGYEWQGTGINNSQLYILDCQLDNFPNPFKPSGAGRGPATTITFSIAQSAVSDLNGSSFVNLEIYNIKGQKVKTLIYNEILPAGNHSAVWYGTDDTGKPVASGVYLCKLSADRKEQVKKMLLLK